MGSSKLDRVYRNLVLSKFFVKGWGNPENIKRLFDFRKVVCDRNQCINLVDANHPVTIVKEEKHQHHNVYYGHFKSPFAIHQPGLVPPESETAHFQMLIPKEWSWKNGLKPMVVQLAGTGDHYFWRRRMLMGNPLLKEWNIGSIILENPFYGLRKPREQKRSCLHNVSDIFVMGGCLILESMVLFHWCQRNGLGPLGVTGISMGGHMASLAATSWPEPVVLVPCLSWSSAAGVFTRGVMSGAIDWSLLENQYCENQIYNEILEMIFQSPSNYKGAFDAGREFAQHYSRNMESENSGSPSAPGLHLNPSSQDRLRTAVEETFHFKSPTSWSLPIRTLLPSEKLKNILNSTSYFKNSQTGSDNRSVTVDSSVVWQKIFQPFLNQKMEDLEKVRARQQAIHFMCGIMDEFTHIANYSRPVDCSTVIVVAAEADAYVPREVKTEQDDLATLWPGTEIRYVPTGHVAAYLLHHSNFRKAVKDGFDRLIEKHYASPSL